MNRNIDCLRGAITPRSPRHFGSVRLAWTRIRMLLHTHVLDSRQYSTSPSATSATSTAAAALLVPLSTASSLAGSNQSSTQLIRLAVNRLCRWTRLCKQTATRSSTDASGYCLLHSSRFRPTFRLWQVPARSCRSMPAFGRDANCLWSAALSFALGFVPSLFQLAAAAACYMAVVTWMLAAACRAPKPHPRMYVRSNRLKLREREAATTPLRVHMNA